MDFFNQFGRKKTGKTVNTSVVRPKDRSFNCNISRIIGQSTYNIDELEKEINTNSEFVNTGYIFDYYDETTLGDLNNQIDQEGYRIFMQQLGYSYNNNNSYKIYNYIEINGANFSFEGSSVLIKDVINFLGTIYQISEFVYNTLRFNKRIAEITPLHSLDQIPNYTEKEKVNLGQYIISEDYYSEANLPIPSSLVAVSLVPDLTQTYSVKTRDINPVQTTQTTSFYPSHDASSWSNQQNYPQRIFPKLITLIPTIGTIYERYEKDLQIDISPDLTLGKLCELIDQFYPFQQKWDRGMDIRHIIKQNGIDFIIDGSDAPITIYWSLLDEIYRMDSAALVDKNNFNRPKELRYFDDNHPTNFPTSGESAFSSNAGWIPSYKPQGNRRYNQLGSNVNSPMVQPIKFPGNVQQNPKETPRSANTFLPFSFSMNPSSISTKPIRSAGSGKVTFQLITCQKIATNGNMIYYQYGKVTYTYEYSEYSTLKELCDYLDKYNGQGTLINQSQNYGDDGRPYRYFFTNQENQITYQIDQASGTYVRDCLELLRSGVVRYKGKPEKENNYAVGESYMILSDGTLERQIN